ncbi:MAG: exodeoxyribonuclease VII large subunit, partial [Flavobacteriales bacterium]
MPEIIAGKKAYTLLDLAQSIQRMFTAHFNRTYWVKAEINKLNYYSRTGHCHPELLQKENDKVVVEFKSIIWKNDYERINRLFLEQIKEPLKDGIKVLCEVSVSYSPQYGISLRIEDIDISYTLGDIEAEKKAAIERLKREGIFNLNKEKTHAMLPRRIAVISVESSKGFADFQEILDAQKTRFGIFRMLFPALLQGDKAVDSLCDALQKISKVAHHFDVVAIIRGGGGDVGLSCFNNFRLANTIATFPIPVYTGIGHSTNDTVCEMVSYYNGITPTKVAQQLLDQFEAFELGILNAQHRISDRTREILSTQHRELHLHTRIIQQVTTGNLSYQHQLLTYAAVELTKASSRIFSTNSSELKTRMHRLTLAANQQLNTSNTWIEQSRKQLTSSSTHVLSKAENNL